jgi:hypothetical protein
MLVKNFSQFLLESKQQSTDRSPINNPDIEKALKQKSEDTGVEIGILRAVMRRGMAAWKTGHRPGAGQEQWGYARVNSFLTKAKGTWSGTDADLAREVEGLNEDYFTGLSKSTIAKKKAQMKKQAAMADNDPEAYKDMPGDTKGKKSQRVSKHTKKYHQMFSKKEKFIPKNIDKRIKDLEIIQAKKLQEYEKFLQDLEKNFAKFKDSNIELRSNKDRFLYDILLNSKIVHNQDKYPFEVFFIQDNMCQYIYNYLDNTLEYSIAILNMFKNDHNFKYDEFKENIIEKIENILNSNLKIEDVSSMTLQKSKRIINNLNI